MTRARILVVEDNAMNRRLVRDVLAFRGHEVVEAASVAEARAHLAEAPVDLVLLDIQLPGGSGVELLAELRADPARAELPVVAVTAYAMASDRDRLLAAGFDGYIAKPIDTRAFGPEVEGYLGRRRGPR